MSRSVTPWALGTVVAAAAIAAAVWLLVGEGDAPFEVRLDSQTVVRTDSSIEPLRVAIAPVLSPDLTAEAYQSLSDYLSIRMPRPVRLVQRKTYGEINELLRHGTVQAAIICTGAYVRASMDGIKLAVIAVPFYKDGPAYYSFFIVRSGDVSNSIGELRNRPFAFSDPLSLSGHYYAISLLLDMGMDPRSFFSQATFTHSHDGSIRAVLDGIADAAAVDSLVYDEVVRHSPSVGNALRVIHRSPPLGVSPVVVPADLDEALRKHFKTAFLAMSESKLGRKTLASLSIERFVAPDPGLYDSARSIVTKVNRYLEERR